jgi:hypothetical protein
MPAHSRSQSVSSAWFRKGCVTWFCCGGEVLGFDFYPIFLRPLRPLVRQEVYLVL